MLCLQLPNGTFTGQIQNLSSVRDTLDRQEILCRFKSSEIKSVENQTLDFQIVHSSGNLLQKCLADDGRYLRCLEKPIKKVGYFRFRYLSGLP